MMIDKNEVPPEIDYTEYWETNDRRFRNRNGKKKLNNQR